MEEERIEEVELRNYLKVLAKRKWAVIITVAVFFMFALIISFSSEPVYRTECFFEPASAVGLIPGYTITIMSSNEFIQLCQSKTFKDRIKESLSLQADENIEIKTRIDEPFFSIFIDSSSPQKDVKILNTALGLLIKENNTIYEEKIKPFKEQKEIIQKQIEIAMSIKSSRGTINYLMYLNQLHSQLMDIEKNLISFKEAKIISPPAVSDNPIRPKPFLNIAVGLVLVGFFLGVFIVFIQEYIFQEKSDLKV